jgi:hypothetical protein
MKNPILSCRVRKKKKKKGEKREHVNKTLEVT